MLAGLEGQGQHPRIPRQPDEEKAITFSFQVTFLHTAGKIWMPKNTHAGFCWQRALVDA
jgi:hypothetical protein